MRWLKPLLNRLLVRLGEGLCKVIHEKAYEMPKRIIDNEMVQCYWIWFL